MLASINFGFLLNSTAKTISRTVVQRHHQVLHQLWRQKDKVVHVVVALYLLLNSNWPRAPCGTRNASIVLNATVHWIQHWPVMVLIRRSIVVPVTVNCSDPKDLVSVTAQLSSHVVVIHILYSKLLSFFFVFLDLV
jgi:hypothetical protein